MTCEPPNEVTGANAGGPRPLPIRVRWAARIAQFCRWTSAATFDILSTVGGRMNGMKSTRQCGREWSLRRWRRPLAATGWAGKVGVAISLLAGSISSWAGYLVDSHVEAAAGTNRYTWTVYNQDQAWGLDGFAIEVPVQTRVLARTVPPPHSNPYRTAYWIMEERYEAWVDPHDGKVGIPAPQPGMKLLAWWGVEPVSVYPPGTAVTFSLTTDASVGPGVMSGSAVTYTPQKDPHYYVSWRGQMLGPSTSVADAAAAVLTGTDPKRLLPDVRSVLVTGPGSSTTNQSSTLAGLLPAASIALHAGVTVEGVVGFEYGIQFSSDLTETKGWHGLANVILTSPKQVWYDPQPALNPQRYYRVVPGPISIP